MVSELGKKIARRQDASELIQKNILREDEMQIAPQIIQNKMALEKERTHDQLNRKLSIRPAKIDLKLRNILRVDSNDSLDSGSTGSPVEKNIDFGRRTEELKSILKKRPEKTTLEEMNIIKGGDIDPSIAATQQLLRRAQLENHLEHKLRERPDIEEVSKIINFSEVVEVLPTFRKSEYNRKPDNNATFKKLTPQMKVMIREELNSFKKNEMPVHEHSTKNTCFHWEQKIN